MVSCTSPRMQYSIFCVSLSSVSSVSDIGFTDLEERINWILFSVKTGSGLVSLRSGLVSLPPALQAKFQAQQSKSSQKKRSRGSDDGSPNSKRQQGSSSSSSSSTPNPPMGFFSPSHCKIGLKNWLEGNHPTNTRRLDPIHQMTTLRPVIDARMNALLE